MNAGWLLIIIGAIVAVALHFALGIVLMIVGIVLLFAASPRL